MSETDTPDDNQISDDDWAAAMQERHQLTGKTVGLTLCGGKVDTAVFAKILQNQ